MAVKLLEQRKTTQATTQLIRVLFLNTRDQLGADVAVHVALARALDRMQARVWAATGKYEASGEHLLAAFAGVPNLTLLPMNLGRPVNGLHTSKRAIALLRNALSVASLARLAFLCRREKIDLIHVTERPRDALFGLLLARIAGCKCLVHAHTSYYLHDRSRLSDWTLEQVDAVVGVSQFTASTYISTAHLPQQRVFAVHNAVDTTLFTPAVSSAERVAMRARFGISPDAPLVGCVARLMRWKGQAELLEAFVAMRKVFPDAQLLLAGLAADTAPDGNGDFRAYLDRRVAQMGLGDAVTFAGFVSHEEMPAFYGALDVLAHPAVEEPFGLAIVEAMACERPVIAVGAGGVPEIIRHEVDGLLIANNSPNTLAVELLRVLGDSGLAGRLGRAARLRVEHCFSPKQQACAVTDIYRRVLKRSPAK